jgi:Lipid A 3-O-deacylase (PagL)
VGTALVLNKKRTGFSTDLGINANFLDRRQFGRQDFGSILQFGAYLGINYCFDNGIKVGYRLQHISNGHLFYPQDTPNPGLDMHLFGTSYVF